MTSKDGAGGRESETEEMTGVWSARRKVGGPDENGHGRMEMESGSTKKGADGRVKVKSSGAETASVHLLQLNTPQGIVAIMSYLQIKDVSKYRGGLEPYVIKTWREINAFIFFDEF